MAAVFHILVVVKAWASSVFQKGSVLVYIESFLAKKGLPLAFFLSKAYRSKDQEK